MKLWRWLRSRPLARVRRTIAQRRRAEFAEGRRTGRIGTYMGITFVEELPARVFTPEARGAKREQDAILIWNTLFPTETKDKNHAGQERG